MFILPTLGLTESVLKRSNYNNYHYYWYAVSLNGFKFSWTSAWHWNSCQIWFTEDHFIPQTCSLLSSDGWISKVRVTADVQKHRDTEA